MPKPPDIKSSSIKPTTTTTITIPTGMHTSGPTLSELATIYPTPPSVELVSHSVATYINI